MGWGMNGIFEQTHADPNTRARSGILRFYPGGSRRRDGDAKDVLEVETPIFMPVGTRASVKGLWQEQLEQIGYRLILANTYHLFLRPGQDINLYGGLKPFMSWEDGAILTDSGGYQVFSLSERVKFHREGVEFSSHIDGSRHLFTPESVVDYQLALGSDIMMVLDDCPPADADRLRLEQSMDRTHRWASEALSHFQDRISKGHDRKYGRLFGIVQGGLSFEHRRISLDAIQSLDFDGIAIGGLSVGESRSEMVEILDFLGEKLDSSRPRYLMGVGTIPDFLEAVKNGIDMFDCVLPTRNGRNGQALTSEGRLNIRNASHVGSSLPLDPSCNCNVCRRYSRGYIRHLFQVDEMLGPILVSYHNLSFFYKFMSDMRKSIRTGEFLRFYSEWKKVTF